MKVLLLIMSILVLNVSCVKDIDLDQVKNSTLSTSMNLALLKIDVDQQDFLDSSGRIIDYENRYLIGFEGLFKDNLKDSINYTVISSNTFSDRPVRCLFTYADKDNNLLPLSDSFEIPQNTFSFTRTLIFEGDDYDSFIKANYIYVTLNMGASDLILPPPLDGEFHLKSNIGFTLERIFE